MSKQRAPLMCRNECGTAIWFDWERKYDDLGYTQNSEKPNIPLEVSETGEHLPKKHQCPNSEYNKSKRGEAGTSSVTTTTTAAGGQGQRATFNNALTKADIEPVLGYAIDTNARCDRIEKRLGDIELKLSDLLERLQPDKLADNPLNDDGDSSRENPEPEEV